MNSSRWSSARWRLDEQEPVDEQSQVEAGGGRRWMNSSPWRLEEVDGGDEQYPVESCFVVRHTPPDKQDPRFDRRRSVSSILRYATPLPIKRTHVSTVGGPFPPFCGTPHPSRSTGPHFERDRSNTRPFPPLCGTPGLVSIACSVQALPMNTTTHSVPTQPIGSHVFRCLPMNMILF